ncbi:MAG: ASCH domain-containing protein [Candidatus Aenigmatarchaeota archaeon]
MKRLKFLDYLPELILTGKKNTTWRVNDEKNIQRGDELSLCNKDGVEFARAVVIKAKETVFGKLTEDDKKGHENFANNEEMYKTYSRYYKMEIAPETRLKIIKFRLS